MGACQFRFERKTDRKSGRERKRLKKRLRTCSARNKQSTYLHGLRTFSKTRVSDGRASRCSFHVDSKKAAMTLKPAEAMSLSEEGDDHDSQITELSEVSGIESESSPDDEENTGWKVFGLVVCSACVLIAALLVFLAFTKLSEVNPDDDLVTDKDLLYVKPSPGAPASRPVMVAETTTSVATETSTTRLTTPEGTTSVATQTSTTPLTTTTESDFDVKVDYSDDVYNDLHQYTSACLTRPGVAGRCMAAPTGSTSSLTSSATSYCICCYALDANMQLMPELPDVDRDAVLRGAALKLKNKFLYMYLAVRGPDSVFELLFHNQSDEYAAFLNNAHAWLKDNKFDGIRLWWQNAPDHHNDSILALGRYVAAGLYTTRMSMGYFVPYEPSFQGPYNFIELTRALLVRHVIILYNALPQKITRLEYYDTQEFGPIDGSSYAEHIRNIYCHLLPLGALSFKLEAPCDVSDSTELEPLVVTDVGDAGPFTRTRGTLATYEACDIMYANGSEWQFKDETKFMYACNNLSAIIFTTPPQAKNFLEAVHDVFYGTCFGYVNPHYDDFPGRCRLGKYPGEPYSWIREMFHLVSDSVKGKTGGHLDTKLPLNLRHAQNASAPGK